MSTHDAIVEEVTSLLAAADVQVGGDRPQDIRVLHDGFYERVLGQGSLGFGESYMEGWWECPAIDQCVDRILRADVEQRVHLQPRLLWHALLSRITNLQSPRRAFEVGEKHYDLGNDLYAAMLDSSMTYSCGYWKDASSLEDAQRAKLDLICRKIGLQSGHRVLDIGCGWGGFARHAAEEYGATVVGCTVSREQRALALERCAGLPVEIVLQDYRTLDGTFDRIVSVGMFEHVGSRNYKTYFKTAERLLSKNGMFLLHTIGGNRSVHGGDPWINTYIFPNGQIPSAAQITKAYEGTFVMEDWHNFGTDYDRTLLAWYDKFKRAWPTLSQHYDERFRRMWRFYLLSCAGAFRARSLQLWQIVFTKEGAPAYVSVR